jgi:hypothetical protein
MRNNPIPRSLYRGDRDSRNSRRLRWSLTQGHLQTNLLNGGDGRRIMQETVWDLVNEHVLSKYRRSDFLSFTESREAAFRFGLKLHAINQEIIEDCVTEFYEDGDDWDFAILTLDTRRLDNVKELAAGVYEATFEPALLEFRRSGSYRVVLIDIVTALKARHNDSYGLATEYSSYDSEWLVLPANTKLFEAGQVQYSALLDMACISATERFTVDKALLETYNTLDY